MSGEFGNSPYRPTPREKRLLDAEPLHEHLARCERMRQALVKLRDHLEEDGVATCDITTMHKIILEGLS